MAVAILAHRQSRSYGEPVHGDLTGDGLDAASHIKMVSPVLLQPTYVKPARLLHNRHARLSADGDRSDRFDQGPLRRRVRYSSSDGLMEPGGLSLSRR